MKFIQVTDSHATPVLVNLDLVDFIGYTAKEEHQETLIRIKYSSGDETWLKGEEAEYVWKLLSGLESKIKRKGGNDSYVGVPPYTGEEK